MSNDSSKLGRAKVEDRALADSDLDAASGGFPLYNLEELLGWGSHPTKVTVPEIKLGISF